MESNQMMNQQKATAPTIPGAYNTYIGARYVPIFDGQWDLNKAYEPLVIVQYQGNSYTSRTFVPVGIVPTNDTYWAETGNYNAQIEYYHQEVINLTNQLNELKDKLKRNIIIIADDYANYPTPDTSYLAKIKQSITPRVNSLLTFTFVGGAFNDNTFLTGFQSILPSIEDINEITEIYIIGGINDVGKSNVPNQINNFINYISSINNKIKVKIIFIAGTNQYQKRRALQQMNGTYSAMSYRSVNVVNFYSLYSYIPSFLDQNDKPTLDLANNLSSCLYNYIINEQNEAFIYYNVNDQATGGKVAGLFIINGYCQYESFLNDISINYTVLAGNNVIEIFEMTKNIPLMGVYNYNDTHISGYLSIPSIVNNSTKLISGTIYIDNSKLVFNFSSGQNSLNAGDIITKLNMPRFVITFPQVIL